MLVRHIAAAALAVTLAACTDAGGGTAPAAPSAPAVTDLKAALWPSSWVVTDIAGTPVVAGSSPTLAFDANGRASGNGTCNRFSGTSAVTGAALTFGPMISTKMACVGEGLNEQETAYLTALGAAEAAETTPSGDLKITASGGAAIQFRKAIP